MDVDGCIGDLSVTRPPADADDDDNDAKTGDAIIERRHQLLGRRHRRQRHRSSMFDDAWTCDTSWPAATSR